MSRVRSDSYDIKREMILDEAAKLFAKVSYRDASMRDIAKACDSSKSMLYHYFTKKDDILFAILADHIEDVIEDIEAINTEVTTNKGRTELLEAFIHVFVKQTQLARSRHMVAFVEEKFLPESQREVIRELERKVIRLTNNILALIRPGQSEQFYTINTLLLSGMLNSMDVWRGPKGKYSDADFVKIVADLFLKGYRKTEFPS